MLNKYQLRVANYLIKRGFRIMHARPVTSNFLPYGRANLVNRKMDSATMVNLDEIKFFGGFVDAANKSKPDDRYDTIAAFLKWQL